MSFTRHHNRASGAERGTVLLMALIIMSGVVISSMGVGSLIVSSLQQSRSLDNGISAFYAAESGVEDGLYAVRHQDALPSVVTTPRTLGNNATWTRAVTNSESVVYAGTISQDSSYEISLYNPDASTTPSNIDHLQITWTDSCSGCTVAQTSLVGWKSGGPVLWDPNAAVNLYTWSGSGVTVSIPDLTKLYRFRIAAKNASMQNVQIRAFDGSGVPTTVPGRVRIDAIGTFNQNSQKLTATLPRGVPLSGIFDFVVFSECSLVKGTSAGSCP
jgi:Tfp pilus assembly protein PilX